MTQPKLFEENTPLDPAICDSIRIVKVENGGARCGSIVVPQCIVTDTRVNYSDRGIYMFICSQFGETYWNHFCVGAPNMRKVESMRRLEAAGYICTSLVTEGEHAGILSIHIRDVVPYTKAQLESGAVSSIHTTRKKAPPVNKAPHKKNDEYKPFDPMDEDNCPTNVSIEVWREFIEFRKDNRFSVRKAHCARMKEKIEGYGRDGEESMRESMGNCWQGLFPVRGEASARSTQILGAVENQEFEDEI